MSFTFYVGQLVRILDSQALSEVSGLEPTVSPVMMQLAGRVAVVTQVTRHGFAKLDIDSSTHNWSVRFVDQSFGGRQQKIVAGRTIRIKDRQELASAEGGTASPGALTYGMLDHAGKTATILEVYADMGTFKIDLDEGEHMWKASYFDSTFNLKKESDPNKKRFIDLPFQERVKQISMLNLTGRQQLKLKMLEKNYGGERALRYLSTFCGAEAGLEVLKYPRAKPFVSQLKATADKFKRKDSSHSPWSSKAKFIGIELEFCLPRTAMTGLKALSTFGLCLHGDSSVRTKLALTNPQRDANGDLPIDPDTTAEISMLVQEGKYDRLKQVLDYLNANGAYVNITCGLHVHLDQRHRTVEEAKKIYSSLQNCVAPLLTKLVEKPRLRPRAFGRSPYCLLNRDMDNKYQAINWLPMNTRKTIEVRLHHGSLNYEEIVTWINTCLACCEAPGMIAPKKIKPFTELVESLKASDELKAKILATASRHLEEENYETITEEV